MREVNVLNTICNTNADGLCIRPTIDYKDSH